MALLAVCAVLVSACSSRPVPGTGPVPSAAAAAGKDTSRCVRTLVGVAHPDDDLFFVNPEIGRTVRAGCAVETLYLTAGDGGERDRTRARRYVERREYGVRAAYAVMAGVADVWRRDDVDAGGIRVRSFLLGGRAGTAEVRLTFLGLHDGLPQGQSPESLLRLFDGSRPRIRAFQSTVRYTEARLLATVSALVRRGGAERVLTLDHDHASFGFGLGGGLDHSDHGIGARYLRRVGYALGVPVLSYLGYTMSSLRPNLSPGVSAEKEEAARWYIGGRECRAFGACAHAEPFRGPLRRDWGMWVHRQYPRAHRAPRPGEILGDIGRTTRHSGRDPAQCLDRSGGSRGAAGVRIRGCDGSAAQRWFFGTGGTIRPRSDRSSCLTARTGTVGLRRCGNGDRAQVWRRVPWRSPSWHRTAWRIVGARDRCLVQDDRELPAHGKGHARRSPRLALLGCGASARPELYWRWTR
ncbi:ricin-type beta-trefoil lectin domain protein [Streptomyces sp. NPDC057638]|uniref:ricin-type beta-trefoil lectin domain protein n=1 Tax=Streptomyces sp. NPDC057638 TaxID=3346190 RepID=UPI0036764AD2